MFRLALAERHALADTALRAGPDAPTLCAGWNVRTLIAHMVVRERRAETAGVFIPKLAPALEKTTKRYALRPFSDLVDIFRSGPHEISPTRFSAVDENVNLLEFFVHHEDILRAAPHGMEQVRMLSDAANEALIDIIPRVSRLTMKSCSYRVAAQVPGQAPIGLIAPVNAQGDLIVEGLPSEIVCHVYGRPAHVTILGPVDAVEDYQKHSHRA